MKRIGSFVWSLLMVVALTLPVQAQEAGAQVIVSGAATFASRGGELFGDEGRITNVVMTPTALYQLKNHLYVGGTLHLTHGSQAGVSTTDFAVGPTAWLFLGDSDLFACGSILYGSTQEETSLAFEGCVGANKDWLLAQAYYAVGSVDQGFAERTGFNDYGLRVGVVGRF